MDTAELEEKLHKECENRYKASIKWRKEKAGKNPFKVWFYLGRKDKHGKYDVENYYSTLYDKILCKRFKKYYKRIEKKGIKLTRQWIDTEDHSTVCRLYKSRRLFDSPYRKYCSRWWRDVFENFRDITKYNYKVCTYDFYDIYENLIVNLTIKGLYFGLHGNATIAKYQMHECWDIRNKLLKAYKCEYYAEYEASKTVKEKYGIDYSPEYKLEDNCIRIVNSPGEEIEDYYCEAYGKVLQDERFTISAFSELAKKIHDLWD